ncbi:MAG: hypothetical protein J5654_02630 [Victivallales bacterium]|nr:hypothetical protein [Victivallales bacterium]
MNEAFHDDLRKYTELCTKSLSDDVELRQQVEHELLDHLEDAFAEEQTKGTEEQALKNALRRFGDPEELASQLAESNARRLSRHARIRRAVKWLFIPILIIGVLLCIDIRGIMASTALLNSFRTKTWFNWVVGLKTRKLSEEEQLLFNYHYGRGNRLEILSALYEKHSDDPMICAIFAQELSIAADRQPNACKVKLSEVLANGSRIDPTNPLYDYLECLTLMREALLPQTGEKSAIDDINKRGNLELALASISFDRVEMVYDRDKLDSAIDAYLQALTKGQIRTYTPELLKSVQGMLKIKNDLLGGMHLIDAAARERLLFWPSFKSISKGIILYCDLLHHGGNNAKAITLLTTWRTYLTQYLGGESTHFVDILGSIRLAGEYLKCAKRLGASDEIAALTAVGEIRREMRETVEGFAKSHHEGGMLTWGTPPYPIESDNIAEWTVERRLEAATFESMYLCLACFVLLVAIAVFGLHALAMRLLGRRPFLFIMHKRVYIGLLLKGILFPGLIFLAISHFIMASNGGLGVVANQVLPAIYLCLLWPLYYGVYSRRLLTAWMNSIGAKTHHAFRASRSLNMLCLLVALLLAIGGILRPISYWRQRYYASRETLVIPRGGVETREKRVIRKWQARLLELCKRGTSTQNE